MAGVLAAAGVIAIANAQTTTTTPPPTPDLSARVAQLEQQLQDRNQAVRDLIARNRKIRIEARRAIRRDPEVRAAIKLASMTHGVPEWQMRRIAFCESRNTAGAVGHAPAGNGERAQGLFQFLPSTWRAYKYGRAGLSPFDPYANAMQAAYVVKTDGGWRQWECKL